MDGLRKFCLASDHCNHFGSYCGNCYFLLFCACLKSTYQLYLSCNFCDLRGNFSLVCLCFSCIETGKWKTNSACSCSHDCWYCYNSHYICIFHKDRFYCLSLSHLDFAWCNAFSWNLHVYFQRLLSFASCILRTWTNCVFHLFACRCATYSWKQEIWTFYR